MDKKVSKKHSARAGPAGAASSRRAPLPVPELPPRVLLDIITDCNLKCPMCVVHGDQTDPRLKEFLKKSMLLENAAKVLDEVLAAKPLVMPGMWSEPTMSPEFMEHIRQIKERDLPVAMNTNGLKMKPDLAQFLVDVKFDSVFFSIDAMTSETLEKVRGITRLDLLHKGVEILMAARDNKPLPRIGVSMTLQDANRHERDAFVEFWTKKVEVVRIGEVWRDGAFTGLKVEGPRKPCGALYNTLAVNTNGNIAICCLDSFGNTNMGNVFKDGVKAVWHGPELTEMRRLHEIGEWDKIPICKNCDRWASYQYVDEVKDGLLIRRSPEYTYYNRLDQMGNWHPSLRGTHRVSEQILKKAAPPADMNPI